MTCKNLVMFTLVLGITLVACGKKEASKKEIQPPASATQTTCLALPAALAASSGSSAVSGLQGTFKSGCIAGVYSKNYELHTLIINNDAISENVFQFSDAQCKKAINCSYSLQSHFTAAPVSGGAYQLSYTDGDFDGIVDNVTIGADNSLAFDDETATFILQRD